MIDRFTVVDVRERMTRAVCKVPMESPVFVIHEAINVRLTFCAADCVAQAAFHPPRAYTQQAL